MISVRTDFEKSFQVTSIYFDDLCDKIWQREMMMMKEKEKEKKSARKNEVEFFFLNHTVQPLLRKSCGEIKTVPTHTNRKKKRYRLVAYISLKI